MYSVPTDPALVAKKKVLGDEWILKERLTGSTVGKMMFTIYGRLDVDVD